MDSVRIVSIASCRIRLSLDGCDRSRDAALGDRFSCRRGLRLRATLLAGMQTSRQPAWPEAAYPGTLMTQIAGQQIVNPWRELNLSEFGFITFCSTSAFAQIANFIFEL
jgi:hypothetical protein